MTICETYAAISQFDSADRMLTRALELARRTKAGDHELIAGCMSDLGSCASMGRARPPMPIRCSATRWRAAAAVEGRQRGAGASLNDVAYGLQAQGRVARRCRCTRTALAMRRRVSQGDHRDVSESLSNLGFCLASLGRLTEAMAMHVAALEMRQRLSKGDHPDIALSLNNVGSTLTLLGCASRRCPV